VLFRIDPQTNESQPVPVPRAQCGPVTASAGLLWFLACQWGPIQTLGVDPATGAVIQRPPLPGVVIGDSLWTGDGSTTLIRLDLQTGNELARVPLAMPPNPDGQGPGAECAGTLWTVNGMDSVQRTDLVTNASVVITLKRSRRGPNTAFSTTAVCAAGKVWVPNAAGLFQIDPGTNRVRRLPIIATPPSEISDVAIASDGDDVYLRTGDTTVARIDGDTGTVVKTYPASRLGSGGGIAVAYNSLWVINTLDGTVWRQPL